MVKVKNRENVLIFFVKFQLFSLFCVIPFKRNMMWAGENTIGKAFNFYTPGLGLVPSTPNGFQSLSVGIPGYSQ